MKTKYLLPLCCAIMVMDSSALAWGGRGHHTICSAAVHLVKNQELKNFLTYRPHVMGHLCNVPDIYWKSLGPKISELGNPTHYIDPDVIGVKIKDMPLELDKIVENYTGKDNQFKTGRKIFSVPNDMGTLWWRADQFVRNIISLKDSFTGAVAPSNFKEEQDENLPYNKTVYQMMLNMGILGHYVGDASQPFHATADSDGWAIGHGGIHSYYEEITVTRFGSDLEKLIVTEAEKLKTPKWLGQSTLNIMKSLSEMAFAEQAELLKLDPLIKKSELKMEKGMELKTPAERKSPEEGFKSFKTLIVKEMARSSLALAFLWQDSYEKLGKPSLSKYRSFKYPLTPDFIAPDYFKTESK